VTSGNASAATSKQFSHTPLLSQSERDLWRLFSAVSARLQRSIDDDLREHAGLSLSEVEVLSHLVYAPGNRLRLAEVADRLVFTRSGVTRLVDKLESQGWITRESCDHDGRGVYALLTEAGFEQVERAAVPHVAAIRRLFLDRLDGDHATMRALLERLEP
jgi:DNA-binding MarR family transcriptional regulator